MPVFLISHTRGSDSSKYSVLKGTGSIRESIFEVIFINRILSSIRFFEKSSDIASIDISNGGA
ncbi:MAG TPA: hypothetical protein PK200_15050, partial [Spirochaetota bacterium]|nr:hypothetical protein [Spirochaetota bacterium]